MEIRSFFMKHGQLEFMEKFPYISLTAIDINTEMLYN